MLFLKKKYSRSQEHFRACADIAISDNGEPAPSPPTPTGSTPSPPATTTTLAPSPPPATTTTTTTSTGGCEALGPWSGNAAMNNWCELNCNHNPPYCPPTMCSC